MFYEKSDMLFPFLPISLISGLMKARFLVCSVFNLLQYHRYASRKLHTLMRNVSEKKARNILVLLWKEFFPGGFLRESRGPSEVPGPYFENQ